MPSKTIDRRPFANLEDLQELFDAIVLDVFKGSGERLWRLENATSFSQDQGPYLTSTFVVSLDTEKLPDSASTSASFVHAARAALATAGFAPGDVVVRVTGMTRRLRMSAVLLELNLDELGLLFDGVVLARGQDRPDVLQAPFGGCDLWVDLLLRGESSERVPLRPWRRGTWLARAEFRVGAGAGTIGFTPLALTDDHRFRLELPTGTVRFVEVATGLLDKPTGNEDIILWLDPDLLSTLASYPKSIVAANLQRQLLVDAVSTVVMRGSRDEAVKDAPESRVRNTLLGRILQMAGADSEDLSEPLDLLKAKPEILIATIEAKAAGVLDGLRKALASEEQENDPS